MNRKTHYEVLGVDAAATADMIKKAYLVRSKMFHPDRFDPASQHNEWVVANDMLKELNESYAVLRDPQKRAAYAVSVRASRPVEQESARRPQEQPATQGREVRSHPVRRRSRLPLVGLLVSLVLMAIVLVKINNTFGLLSRVPNLSLVPSAAGPSLELPLPPSGEMQNSSSSEALAPFQIVAPPGSSFVVKLEDASTQRSVLTIFVRSGNLVKVHVPLGTYVVKYAFGERWYGYKDLFGPGTKYAKASRPFVFKAEGKRYSGYALTLSNMTNGNLRAPGIEPAEF